MGDIFEAYVAAVILSDPAGGLARAISWLKALWGMTLRKEIIQEEKCGLKIDNPLWRLRGSIGLDDPSASVEAPPLNPKERLHKMLGAKGETAFVHCRRLFDWMGRAE
jgi:ribonuclease-3